MAHGAQLVHGGSLHLQLRLYRLTSNINTTGGCNQQAVGFINEVLITAKVREFRHVKCFRTNH